MGVEFPWKELGSGATVCDVAGGVGNISIQLAKTHPNLRLILQDLPERIQQAKDEIWPKECSEAIAEGRITFEPIDFFASSPVPGCNVYFVRDSYLSFFLPFLTENSQLKNIMCVLILLTIQVVSGVMMKIFSSHNWPDADCIKILSSVKKAMAPHSRVLIRKSYFSNFTSKINKYLLHLEEYILQPANRVPEEKSPIKQAPEPLLPNYGGGRIGQYNLDLHMMAMLNSEERRLPQFIKLGEAAGLKFVKLWDLGEMGLVEYRLHQAPRSHL